MLSFMASEYFQKSPMLVYPLVALALFMLVFFVVTLKTVLTRGAQYEGIARLPLEQAVPVPCDPRRKSGQQKESGHV
jgi:hypothetical protein